MKLHVPDLLRPYEIVLSSKGLDDFPARFTEMFPPTKVILASNPLVFELYGKKIKQSLEPLGHSVLHLEIPDGEEHKNIESYISLLNILDAHEIGRDTPLIALGGGVTGDLAVFIAPPYLRGLPLVHIPTTLLSMVDSSVGSKVGVNTAASKNRVGAFYPPSMVFIATSVLKTLSPKDIRSGLGEVIKHGLLADDEILKICESESQKVLELDTEIMEILVYRNCLVKSKIVTEDSYEKNKRKLLNFGHTVGHALESALGYGVKTHGECVSIGLLSEMMWAVKQEALSLDVPSRVQNIMRLYDMDTSSPQVSIDSLIDSARFDKKRKRDTITTTLLHDVADPELKTISMDQLPQLFTPLMELS